MKKRRLLPFVFIFILLFTQHVYALEPMPEFFVNDYVGILTEEQKQDLIQRSAFLQEENGVQVVTVIVNNVIGGSIDTYANDIFNDFGIGSATDNNGLLLLLAVEDREIRIEVGDGMEAYVPDTLADSILSDFFIPLAQGGDMAQGVYETHKELIRVGSQSTTAGTPITTVPNNNPYTVPNNQYATTHNAYSSSSSFPVMFFVAIIVGVVFLFARTPGRYRSHYTVYRRPPIDPYHPPLFPPHHHHHTHSGFFGGSGFWDTNSSQSHRTQGGGGHSSGGGSSRSFSAPPRNHPPSGGGSFGGGSFGGGGGHSSGGGSSSKF